MDGELKKGTEKRNQGDLIAGRFKGKIGWKNFYGGVWNDKDRAEQNSQLLHHCAY